MPRLHHPLKPLRRSALTGFVLAAALASTAAANQQPREVVRVLRVNDGQEVLVESQGQGRTVKLSCLEAPRPDQQPWASEATAALRELLPEGTEITLDMVRVGKPIQRMERPLEAPFGFDQQATILTTRFVGHSSVVDPPIHP